jgi:phospholipid/cholesterol/gamma-HCH transport system permease protein
MISELKMIKKFFSLMGSELARPHQIRWSLVVIETLKMIRQSIPIVLLSGIFVGGIMAIVFENQLSVLKATAILGALSSSATMREVGPLLIAFMLSGKCGAYVSSEISSMKATDQLDSLKSLGLSAFRIIIMPRVIGIFMAVMFTLFIGLFSSICGCMIMAIVAFDMHPYQFFEKFDWLVNWATFGSGYYKCFMFGLAISLISTYSGWRSEKTSAGVGRAVQYAAIGNMLAIILLDSFTTHTYGNFIHLLQIIFLGDT